MRRHGVIARIVFLFCLPLSLADAQLNTIPSALPVAPVRQQVCLNGIWQFKSNAGGDWTDVAVPGSYAGDAQQWGGSHWDVWRYPASWQGRGGVYRTTFIVPPSMVGKNLTFYCGGARHHTHVLLNGHEIGVYDEGYEPFEFDMGGALQSGKNQLQVVIDDTGNDLFEDDENNLRGMQGDTYLKSYGPLRITDDAFVQTSVAKRSLTYQISIKNYLQHDQMFFVRNYVTDETGKVVKTFDGGWQTAPPTSGTEFTCSSSWSNPHLWSTYDPYLYHLNTVLYGTDGKPLDCKVLRFGFREITWRGPHLYLNGHELFLHGDGRHSEGDIESTRSYYLALCKELKSVGVNFMRLHTASKNQALYDVADEQGMLLESEASHFFRLPAEDRAKQHLTRLIISQRNHPSVLVWSVSNELRWQNIPEPQFLIDLAHQLDPTRPAFASDFSQFSVHGDVLGHHYDAMQVFDEWQQYGPNKPMIWDEMGDIWEHDRKLANGTAGLEVSDQDYATGIWPDGADQVENTLSFIRDGKTFNGDVHRVSVVEPWDFSLNFFRWLPINENRGFQPLWKTMTGQGVKATYIDSCSVATNIWDPVLPVFQPNPAYYLFAKDMRPVLFLNKRQSSSFFGGGKIVISTKLYYNDLRPADTIVCRVETPGGKVITQKKLPLLLDTGDVKDNIALTFLAPNVKSATPVSLARQFYNNGIAGYADPPQPAMIFPHFAETRFAHSKGAGILVIDRSGSIALAFKNCGIPVMSLPSVPLVKASDVLICSGSASSSAEINQYARNGGRVLRMDLSANAPAATVPAHAYLPLNGLRHRVLIGLDQASFTNWNGSLTSELPAVPIAGVNMRVLLLGDKDGSGLAMTESYIGSGVIIDTSLPILETLQNEPAAGWLLGNVLNYLAAYRAPASPSVTLFAGSDQTASIFQSLGARLYRLQPGTSSPTTFKPDDLLILDGGMPDHTLTFSPKLVNSVQTFVRSGGRVLIYRLTASNTSEFSTLVGKEMHLTEPFLEERTHCVKAAVSWGRRDTPQDLVEYYDGVLIPQPFEPNYDPLISGIANKDLDWGGVRMFDQGVEIAGMDPARASEDHSILISNWRNDWSRPGHDLYGEYTNGVRDMRQADWFVNRDPVVLKINVGKGCFVISQLDFATGGDAGKRVLSELLTGLGCPLGGSNSIPADSQTFDSAPATDQLARFAKTNNIWPPGRRIYYGTPNPLPDDWIGSGADTTK